MAKIERFEDLEVWQAGMKLCSFVYNITNADAFSRDALCDQIRKSVISVPSNISEGYERDSKKQFVYFFGHCQRFLWGATHSGEYRQNAELY